MFIGIKNVLAKWYPRLNKPKSSGTNNEYSRYIEVG